MNGFDNIVYISLPTTKCPKCCNIINNPDANKAYVKNDITPTKWKCYICGYVEEILKLETMK